MSGMWKQFLLLSVVSISAEANEVQGYVAVETRAFTNDAKLVEQGHNFQPSIVTEPEWYHVSDDDAHTFTFKPFLRLDSVDDERTHFDIRDLSYLYQADDWEVKAGISSVFWGVTESRHLVDIVNQYDTVEDTDEEDKLGQPMLQFSTFQDWGTLRLFYLPVSRERTFPGAKGRLRSPLVVSDNVVYESGAEEFYPSAAIRYEKVAGDFDIGLSHYHGTAREPRLVANGGALDQYYDIIDQTGLDLQYTTDAWLWKLESINRAGHSGGAFQAASGGFEYTLYQLFDSDKDLGLLTEYHFDNRQANAPTTLFDNDIFAGARLTWNDADDSALLVGMLADVAYGQLFYSVEFEKRIGNNWKIEAAARLNSNADAGTLENALNQDDFVQLRLARYF